MNREQILETRTKLGLELNDSPIMMHELYQKGFYIACDKTGRFDIDGLGIEVSKRISFYNQERNLVFDLDVFDVNEERILANKVGFVCANEDDYTRQVIDYIQEHNPELEEEDIVEWLDLDINKKEVWAEHYTGETIFTFSEYLDYYQNKELSLLDFLIERTEADAYDTPSENYFYYANPYFQNNEVGKEIEKIKKRVACGLPRYDDFWDKKYGIE